jgi:predicted HicB family RNase H-like nuclease
MLNQDLKYYQSLEYNIIIENRVAEGENNYIAYSSELGKYACYGIGENQSEAISNYLLEKEGFIEYLFNNGMQIPEPKKEEKYSGYFNVRTSPLIHSLLVNQAKELEISLNLYTNQILAAAVEVKMKENCIIDKLVEVCNKIDTHHLLVTKQLNYQRYKLEATLSYVTEYSSIYTDAA